MRPGVRSVLSAIALISAMCFGQSSFQEINPGASTRNDAERILGRPTRAISASLFEYNPPAGIAKVEVEYSASSVVERIEVYFIKPVTRSAILQKFNLPPQSDARKTNADRKPMECFGGSDLMVLTYATMEESGGIASIGYYGRNLFENVVGKTGGGRSTSPVAGGSRSTCFGDDAGMASTNRSEHFLWAQRQSVAELNANLEDKINRLFNCASLNGDQLAGAFADVSVVIARSVRNWNCFAGDRGALSEDWSGHKEWASNRSQSELVSNLRGKMNTAFKCLDRSGKSSLFAGSSVALARASVGEGSPSLRDQ